MDTKLKKTHKLTTVIIALCVLLPAFLLVSLYPRIGSLMKEKREEYERLNEEMQKEHNVAAGENGELREWTLYGNFANYAVEASYYLYGQSLEEAHGIPVNYEVLKEYGWLNDFEKVRKETRYHAQYHVGDRVIEKKNADVLEEDDTLGYMTLTFDSYGYLSEVSVEGNLSVREDYEGNNLQAKAKKSMEQYKTNATEFRENYEMTADIDESQLVPKNFTITFAVDEDCDFVYAAADDWSSAHYYYWYDEGLLVEVGGAWLIAVGVVFVAFMALILPFFKKLETGFEKPFCIPLEFAAGLIIAGVSGAALMFQLMAWTGMNERYLNSFMILGYEVPEKTQYIFLLILNFLGWAVLFFAEYAVIASLRQFFCGPKYYLKNRIFCLRIFKWITGIFKWLKKQILKFYRWVTNIDIRNKLNSSIIKIVLVNFVILTALCTLWFFGIFGSIIYSIALYILLCKYGEKLQKQYNSILHATEQMAEGNLKISLEEDLGPFQAIGDSLEKVQQGFAKAVVEEAKSQNMRTELITNVSHDLKTPLTAIITYVDLLKNKNISEEERLSYIWILDQKSQRLKVLIEDLFEVSKANSGNVSMNFLDIDIVNLMKQVKMEMADQLEASGLTYRFNLPEEKVMLSLDGQRTYRVFENLLNNTIKYAMPHTRVYVDILNTEEDVKVVIRNISAQELDYEPERLTERFVRGDAARKSEGSGLGLAIAKSFVELQNGKLNIEVDGDLFKVILTWKK